MLPETLGDLMVLTALTGVLSSVVISLIEFLSQAFHFEFDSQTRDIVAKALTLVAALVVGGWSILAPEVQAQLSDLYGAWYPVLSALLALLAGGAFRLGQQGYHRAVKSK